MYHVPVTGDEIRYCVSCPRNLDVHVEFADIADEEVHDLAVVGKLPPRQQDPR